MKDEGGQVTIKGEGFGLTFERATGRMVDFHAGGRTLIQGGPVPNVWRAPTDNDSGYFPDVYVQKLARHWRAAGLDCLTARVTRFDVIPVSPHEVRLKIDLISGTPDLPEVMRNRLRYWIYATGDIVVQDRLLPFEPVRSLPRVGLTLTLPSGLERLTWYGRGPHDSYPDRKQSAAVGVYDSTVDAQYVPYIVPQEHGNHSETRWAALTGPDGAGLLVAGLPLLNVSASHYSSANLTAAAHTTDLVRQPEIVLNLDHKQTGLGNGSCGPFTLTPYIVDPREYTFGFRMRAVTIPDADPAAFAARVMRLLTPGS